MSVWTGGGYADGSYNVGTPSGGGTFLNHFPIGGPHPEAEGFGEPAARATEAGTTGSWGDFFKQLAATGAGYLIQKHLGPDTSAQQPPPTPNNKGNIGSGPERMPDQPDIFLPAPPPAPRGDGGSGLIRIGLVAAGLFALVMLPALGKG